MVARRLFAFAFIVSFAILACTREPSSRRDGTAGEIARNERVQQLFDTMAKGLYTTPLFPALTWDDVPTLLALGGSKRTLTSFPSNPLSSQSEPSCSEGMVALWLVEGIRKGGQFPSLNALCFGEAPAGQAWGAASESNHDGVLTAYKAWWARVRELGQERAAAIDPLLGTGLHWH